MKFFPRPIRLPLSVVVAVALSAGWVQADDDLPNCYILSAGVDNYQTAKKLNGCLNDARNATKVFRMQEGRLFGRVYHRTLLDESANGAEICKNLHTLTRRGKPGDVVVLFLSGHGGNDKGSWYFLPFDYDARDKRTTALTDRQILVAADAMVRQGKRVIVIVDACYSGQLGLNAESFLEDYQDRDGGGLVLLLSSSKSQTSAALGQYSAFAKAFVDGLAGKGDLNNDGTVTLAEIGRYAHLRTHSLLKDRKIKSTQDSQTFWSPSIPDNMPLAARGQVHAGRMMPVRMQRSATGTTVQGVRTR